MPLTLLRLGHLGRVFVFLCVSFGLILIRLIYIVSNIVTNSLAVYRNVVSNGGTERSSDTKGNCKLTFQLHIVTKNIRIDQF